MCIIALSYQQHPDYPLLLAANRDEFFARPTAALGWWPDGQILAGTDLQAGGTWLGVSRKGRMAALTNFRNPRANQPNAPSRGQLVSTFLASQSSAADFATSLLPQLAHYNGFNLLLFDGQQLFYVSSVEAQARPLPAGLYVVSNHVLGTPWPKVERLKQGMLQHLAEPRLDTEALFDLLSDRQQPQDKELPDTGVGLEWERRLASIFVAAPGYGTRASSLLRLGSNQQLEMIERSFDESGRMREIRRFTLTL
jgi:uncharacterized protein with NRDE domain